MPCRTSRLLKNLQYFDLSDNLLTDMTLAETLCNGAGVLKDLRVLNVSGNALKVPSLNTRDKLMYHIHHGGCVLVEVPESRQSRILPVFDEDPVCFFVSLPSSL